ncbi:MAG: ABC transporter permease [Acidimicrobiales bacterium]
MRAMILKEFRQMRRDRRTLALMVGLPLMMLIIFGYAARFDIKEIDTAVIGPGAQEIAAALPEVYLATEIDPTGNRTDATELLRNSEVGVAFVTSGTGAVMMIDGTELFVAQSALRRVPPGVAPEVLFNPNLDTAKVMVPALIGLVLLFVGTVITSLGVVREREQGTLEQLAVMPLRPIDVTVGKIAPYFLVATIDMVFVTLAGLYVFDVPFEGSFVMFALFGLTFTFVVLGIGVAISTVSQSQGEAIQLAIMLMLPQIMLSGMIFPLESMAGGVRWIGYLLPLTWFVIGSRSLLLKGTDPAALLLPLGILILMAIVVFGVAVIRFRRDLTPKQTEEALRTEPRVTA